MHVETLSPCSVERGKNQRDNHDSQNGVQTKQGKVKSSNQTVTRESRYPVEIVVGQIADQKENRCGERRKHASLVRGNILSPNKVEAANQQHGAGSIKRGIDYRKEMKHELPVS